MIVMCVAGVMIVMCVAGVVTVICVVGVVTVIVGSLLSYDSFFPLCFFYIYMCLLHHLYKQIRFNSWKQHLWKWKKIMVYYVTCN